MNFSLKNQVAVITGGDTGIGYAIAKSMHEAGATVIALGLSSEAEGKKAMSNLGANTDYFEYNVTETGKAQDMVDQIIEKYGYISILMNNAGNHCKKPVEEMTVEDYVSVLNVHLVGAFALSKAVIPHMKERRDGSILFQASMTSYIGQPNVAGYSTAKAGYLGLMHTLASECGTFGVRVNAIAPGWIDTPIFHKATDNDPPRLAKIMGRIPMGKVGQGEDIGMAAVFLSSSAARYITGVCLPVDGGALIGF